VVFISYQILISYQFLTTFSTETIQAINFFPLKVSAQMRVPLSHGNAGMTKMFLYRFHGCTPHKEMGSTRVPEIVPAKIPDPCLFQCGME
jgi:hypothetical protein